MFQFGFAELTPPGREEKAYVPGSGVNRPVIPMPCYPTGVLGVHVSATALSAHVSVSPGWVPSHAASDLILTVAL